MGQGLELPPINRDDGVEQICGRCGFNRFIDTVQMKRLGILQSPIQGKEVTMSYPGNLLICANCNYIGPMVNIGTKLPCPVEFKGPQCQYKGPSQKCDKSWACCDSLNNTKHFKGTRPKKEENNVA
jgi:hypothetical protein